jgi:hypothetical protein
MSFARNASVLIIAITALLLFALASMNNTRVSAADAPSIASQHNIAIDAQARPADDKSPYDSQRIDVVLWTLLAAGGAAGVGLILLGVRIGVGWVKPPPEQDDTHH